MPVEVRVPPMLRRHTGSARSVNADGGTISEVLDDLEAQFPGIHGQMFTAEGRLHPFVNIYLNDQDIRFLSSLDTTLSEGDIVLILPAISGGAGLE